MGILNATPDSFSDGGRYRDPALAAAHALEMARDGAAWIDVGGESTRPGSARVAHEEEWRRVEPVLHSLAGAGLTAHISLDTRHPETARRAIEIAPALSIAAINYVAAEGEHERVLEMARLAHEAGTELILTHVRGTLENMHTLPPAADVVGETLAGLGRLRDLALHAGMPRERLMLDPGFGFGKNGGENFLLLSGIARFCELGCRVVVGVSRKRFLGRPGDQPENRDRATLGALVGVADTGCYMARVHNVSAAAQALSALRLYSRS